MSNFRTPRLLAAAVLAAVAAACSGDGPTTAVDMERALDARSFAASHSGESGVYLCKITFMSFDLADGDPEPYVPANDPTLGVTFNFDISGADVSSASLPAADWGVLSENDCQLIYDGNAGGSITIVETSPASVMNSVFAANGFPKGTVSFLGVDWDGSTRTVALDPVPAGESWIVVKNTVTDTPTPDPLGVTKTANASYDRTYRWGLTKTVDPNSHSGAPGDEFQSIWTVTATKFSGDDNFQVTGNITVTNSNDFAVAFSLSDVLDDGTAGAVTCPTTNDNTGTVPANGSVVCSYSASPTDASATQNTVTVTSSVGGDSDTQGFTWVPNVSGDNEVTLSDPRVSYSNLISSSTTLTPPEQFVCPTDEAMYTNGVYENEYTNTAFLDGANTDLEASAKVKITCTMPAEGRMTGGGVKAVGLLPDDTEVPVTLGLTLHCDNTLSNNLEVNWPHKNQWHIKKESLFDILCTKPDDPTPPVAPISRFEAKAIGRLNGEWGSMVHFVFEDKGEPGRDDTIWMVIYPGMDDTADPVLRVPFQTLPIGNFQMHYDQPHGQKPSR